VLLITLFHHAFKIISPALIPYFSAGEFFSGADIIISQGFIISIYAHIHSKLQFNVSSKVLASFGGKKTVYLSQIASIYH